MEDGLVLSIINSLNIKDYEVLILIVMEDGLVRSASSAITDTYSRLNPYCNGRWSRTCYTSCQTNVSKVLILIVMEDGLVHASGATMCFFACGS